MSKIYLDGSVLEAAQDRICFVFDEFENVCVSFSGGKDSTVLLELARAEAIKRNRKIFVIFIDWEAQYQATITHITEAIIEDPRGLLPIWIALPISTPNESSFHDPMWTAWDEGKEDIWVRAKPNFPCAVTNYEHFPFYRYGMLFEEFVPDFDKWFDEVYGPTAFLIGIRSDESLHRFRVVKGHKGKKRYRYNNVKWSTKVADNSFGFYPIYDWRVDDIWKYIGESRLGYNHIYDLMYRAGMSVNEMRICEPFSLEARKHVDKYQHLEPDTWERMVRRVGGANFGKHYGKSNLFAHQCGKRLTRPENLTWQEYAELLLGSMPSDLRAHYERRINVFRQWFRDNLGWDDIKEESDPALEAKKLGGSWRMVCRTLLKNDYFCHGLSFQANKKEFEKLRELKEKYKDI